MRKLVAIIALLVFAVAPLHAKEDLEAVKKRMISESLSQYQGNCPCPYNYASNGSHCGARSAYTKRGGTSPLCYPTDITDEQAREWQQEHED
jgi:hypothetical protein